MLREALSAAIIVPTRHESGNVLQLHHELDDALGNRKWRLVFVDDSDDRTVDVLRGLEADDDRGMWSIAPQASARVGSAVPSARVSILSSWHWRRCHGCNGRRPSAPSEYRASLAGHAHDV